MDGSVPIGADVRGEVLVIGPMPPPIGGVSMHVRRLSRELSNRGIAHTILDESRIAKEGILNLRRLSPSQYLRLMRRARLVHIHSSNGLVRLAHTIAARMLGAKVLHTVHSIMGSRASEFALRMAGLLGHRGIGVNERIALAIGGGSVSVPAFIAPGADEEGVEPPVASWLAEQRTHGRTIIAMNAFRAELHEGVDLYGLDMLIEAFAEGSLGETFAAIVCIATTQDFEAYQAELDARVAALGLGDRFRMIVGPTSFAGVLKRCDIFIRPTTTDGDAISLREALWYGLPAIASDAVPRPDGTILFRSRDRAGLSQRIEEAAVASLVPQERRDFADDVINLYRELMHGCQDRLPSKDQPLQR